MKFSALIEENLPSGKKHRHIYKNDFLLGRQHPKQRLIDRAE